MACCDKCGNYNDSHLLSSDIEVFENDPDYQPDLYYYWQYPLEEDYQMPSGYECLSEICFDILNVEGKITWKDDKNPFDVTV